jgi:copper transport protein
MHRAPFLALFLAALLTIAAAAPARAHAVLVESVPADAASVAEPPIEIRLRFNEPVSPVAVRLLDAQAIEVPGVTVEARGEVVLVRPAAELPPGGYFLSYRVTSLDAHAVGATVRFGVAVPAPGADPAVADRRLAWAASAIRWLLYVAALGAAGATLFVAFVRPPAALARPTTTLATRLAWVALGTVVVRLGVAGIELGDLPLAALATARPWALAMTTSLATASLLACLGLASIVAAARLPGWGPAVGAAAVALSFALTGHAASAPPRWLTGTALTLHAFCAAFWLGSLPPLARALGLPRTQAVAVLRRFSALATWAVAVLVVAGATLAWVQLGGAASQLWGTAYGVRLLVKLALVAALLAIAAGNRFLLTPALAAGGAPGRLRLTLGADVVLAVAVLAVTATFPLSPPPRAVAPATDGVTVVVPGPGGQATLSLLPGRRGRNRLEAGVVDRDGAPVLAREGSLSWSTADGSFQPARASVSLPAPGAVIAEDIMLPRAGRWRLRLDLLVDDFTMLTFEGEIDVR